MSTVAQYYQKHASMTQVDISSSNELVILVFEKIFESLKLGIYELNLDNYGIVHFTRAFDLINMGLLASLDFEKGQDIAKELDGIYRWCLREILLARIQKSPEKIQKVIEVLNPLYEGWLSISPKKNIQQLSPHSDSKFSFEKGLIYSQID